MIITKTLRNNRGIALLITVSIITILVTVSLELNREVRTSVIASSTLRDWLTLTHMTGSAIQIGMGILIEDKKGAAIDSLEDDWADQEHINEILQEFPFESGEITLNITDELGKIQINALVNMPEGKEFNGPQQNLWDRIVRFMISQNENEDQRDDVDPTAIVNAIKDWLDFGDDDAITGLNGAESDYYEDLDPSYPCQNGIFHHLHELLLVKGIPELINPIGGLESISKYMTVFGMKEISSTQYTFEGKININTAELPVIAALTPSENEELAMAIFAYREENKDSENLHDLSSPTWYKNAPGCSDLVIDPSLIRLSSDIFRLEAQAGLNDMKITTTAVVERLQDKKTGKWKCRILSWETS